MIIFEGRGFGKGGIGWEGWHGMNGTNDWVDTCMAFLGKKKLMNEGRFMWIQIDETFVRLSNLLFCVVINDECIGG